MKIMHIKIFIIIFVILGLLIFSNNNVPSGVTSFLLINAAYPPPSNTSAYPPPDNQITLTEVPTQSSNVGPDCVIDSLNQIAISIPEGWYASTPTANSIGGATVISNFDPKKLKSNHGSVELPENHLRLQITSAKNHQDESILTWISNQKTKLVESDPLSNETFYYTENTPIALFLNNVRPKYIYPDVMYVISCYSLCFYI